MVLYGGLAVAASGGTAMHATSPTKLASPTGIETVVSSSGNVVTNSTSSVPIATSTPVNLPTSGAGGAVVSVAPPPLSVGVTAVDGSIRTSYPAVLKGRSGASPPNPNLVPSGKVPPPVPPRGSGGRSNRAEDQRGNASSSSSTSGRGEANLAYKLHESTRSVSPLAKTFERASGEPPHSVPTPLHAIFPQRPVRPEQRLATLDENLRDLHANLIPFRGSTTGASVAGKATIQSAGFLPIPERTYQQSQQNFYRDRRYRDEEEDEFVSVEKYEDNYIIRTSPSPFRPERGRYRFAKSSESGSAVPNQPKKNDIPNHTPTIGPKERSNAERYAESMNKFTYFINPGGTTYKMSRKDKKHSETYAERIRRQQEEALLASGGRMKLGVIRNNPEIFIQPASFITPVMRAKAFREENKREIYVNASPDGRKKKTAPRPSFRKQIFTTTPKGSRVYLSRSEKKTSTIRRANVDYLRHADRDMVVSHLNDSEIVERREITVELYGERSVRQAASDSSLLAPRATITSKSLASRDYRYSTRRRASMKVLTPNIRMENKRHPETLKTYLSDHEYKDYLNETSSREELALAPPNTSFLHGYASTRSYK